MSHYLFFAPLSLHFYKLNSSSFFKSSLLFSLNVVENFQELSNSFYEEYKEPKDKDGST